MIEALLILSLTALPAYLVGVAAALAAWPLVIGVALATLVVSTGFAMDTARRMVAREYRVAALSMEEERVRIAMERAELNAINRRTDYERQLLRREGTLIAQERRELEQLRQRQEKQQEKQVGELTGARAHVQRIKRKLRPKPEDKE